MLDLAVEGVDGGQPFANEPWCDFSQADMRERFRAAISSAAVPTVANNATADEARAAVARAHAAFDRWRDRDWTERAAMLG